MTFGDYYRYMMWHEQQLRNSISDPSEETLRIWKMQDARKRAIYEFCRQDEAAEAVEDYNIHITSEVKVK